MTCKLLRLIRKMYVCVCTLNIFQLTELNDGSMTITPYLAIESANLISKAVNSTNTLHGADIMIAEQMIRKLLDYEETQTGLNLTHIQDKDYIQV